MVDPWLRLDARLGLLRRATESGPVPDGLLTVAHADTGEVDELRRCEALARLATAIRGDCPERARECARSRRWRRPCRATAAAGRSSWRGPRRRWRGGTTPGRGTV